VSAGLDPARAFPSPKGFVEEKDKDTNDSPNDTIDTNEPASAGDTGRG
jgi:hypothetical protein